MNNPTEQLRAAGGTDTFNCGCGGRIRTYDLWVMSPEAIRVTRMVSSGPRWFFVGRHSRFSYEDWL